MSDPTDPYAGGQPPPQPPPQPQQQYGAQPQYQQPAYTAPPRNPAQTMSLVAGIVIIAGCVAAGAGLLAGFLAFAVEGYSTTLKFQEFFYAVATGGGLGAIAVAAGFLLKTRAQGGPGV